MRIYYLNNKNKIIRAFLFFIFSLKVLEDTPIHLFLFRTAFVAIYPIARLESLFGQTTQGRQQADYIKQCLYISQKALAFLRYREVIAGPSF